MSHEANPVSDQDAYEQYRKEVDAQTPPALDHGTIQDELNDFDQGITTAYDLSEEARSTMPLHVSRTTTEYDPSRDHESQKGGLNHNAWFNQTHEQERATKNGIRMARELLKDAKPDNR